MIPNPREIDEAVLMVKCVLSRLDQIEDSYETELLLQALEYLTGHIYSYEEVLEELDESIDL